jgi:hypothetical protein
VAGRIGVQPSTSASCRRVLQRTKNTGGKSARFADADAMGLVVLGVIVLVLTLFAR